MRNRIILVRMAAGTFQSQSHDARPDHGDRIVDDSQALRHKVHCARTRLVDTHSKETGCGEVFDHLVRYDGGGFGVEEFVACDLFQQKAIVRFVFVERVDDIVAILPRFGSQRIGRDSTFRICIACQVKPIAAPTLTVMRRRQ